MKNNKWKINLKYLEGKAKRIILNEKKKLKRYGAIIVATIILTSGVLIIFKIKNKQPELEGKPAKEIIYQDKKEDKKKIFLERAESLKSGIYRTTYLVFGEEKLRLDVTVGESSKDVITVQGDFKVKYSINIKQMDVSYDFNTEEVILKVPKDAINVDSVELIGDIKETYKYESFGNKIKKVIPSLNNDEELKELAIRQLLRNSKDEANKYDKGELQNKAKDELSDLVQRLNYSDLKYKIKFVEPKTIGIARNR